MAQTQKPIPPETAASTTKQRGAMHRKWPFWRDESGAISVDWVVLCAAMVGLVGATFSGLTPVVINRISSMMP